MTRSIIDPWGHTREVYESHLVKVAPEALSELDLVLQQAVPTAVYRLDLPKTLAEMWVAVALLARTSLCWLLAEGYVELTEKGTASTTEIDGALEIVDQLTNQALKPKLSLVPTGGYL